MSSSQNERVIKLEAEKIETIFKLEAELQNLKQELGLVKTPKQPKLIWRFLDGAVKYWTLVALVGIGIVQLIYGVPYFESIQNSSTRNDSSESFRLLGDNMMEHAEFVAAREAYSNSLLINPNNIEATHGLMKADVLKPVGAGERYSPVVVDAKLRFLTNLFKNDYVLPYWEGVKLRDENNQKGAKDCFAASIKRNPKFIGGYLELGYTNLIAGDNIEIAIHNFEAAVKLDPNYALANNSLGYCYMYKITLDPTNEQNVRDSIKLAINYLKASNRIASDRADIKLNLGDAFRYNRSYQPALVSHLNALELIEGTEAANKGSKTDDIYSGVQLVFPYITKVGGKDESVYVQVTNREQMKVFVFYALSFDHALMGDLESAAKRFSEGYQLDKRREYDVYFAQRIRMISAVLKPEGKVKDWFDARMTELLRNEVDSEDLQKEKQK